MTLIVVLSGSSNPTLADRICSSLCIERGDVGLLTFLNGETLVTIAKLVREKDVYIVQLGCGHVNNNFFELLVMILAAKTSLAAKVTAVLPLFPYLRQPDIPYTKKGAPLVAAKRNNTYTFESVPGTPASMLRELLRPPELKTVAPMLADDFKHKALDKVREMGPAPSWPSPGSAPPLPTVAGGLLGDLLPTRLRLRLLQRIPTILLFSQTPLATSPQLESGQSGYKEWVAQSGTLIANLLMAAGADHIITLDLHDPTFQGFFDIPIDNLYARPLLAQYIKEFVPDHLECVVVLPDAGGAKRAIKVADAVGCLFALIHKERRHKLPVAKEDPNHPRGLAAAAPVLPQQLLQRALVATTMLVGDVRDKVCVIVDDLVDTLNTITRAAKLLKDQGARYVYALATHGVFSGDALQRIRVSSIDKMVVTNLVPQLEHLEMLGDKLQVLDVLRVLAEAIRRIHNGESVSMLYAQGW